MLKSIVEAGAALLFPKTCEACPEVLSPADAEGVCVRCSSAVTRLTPPFSMPEGSFHFDRAYAALLYEGRTRDILKAFKYRSRRAPGRFLGRELSEFAARHLDPLSYDVLAAVPADPHRASERGFNQARVLCRAVAAASGKPDLSDALERRRSAAQSLLGKTARLANIAGSFSVSRPGAFAGLRVVLVDDVLTTGATASECARVLKEAGARSVAVLAAARAGR